ncbi:hypothetical protein V7111_09045 [Neobacillus niacini]|uniref:hypothetical protein n=1 Tax=Neobacillus niacini TaxID=86668 RepID=UPI003000CB04
MELWILWAVIDEMNAYRINKFLSQLSQDEEKTAKFLERDTALFENYGLTQEEREAVISCHATKLYEAGVHPLLMMHLSIILKKDIKELYQKGL